jgi:WD40 repeat protein
MVGSAVGMDYDIVLYDFASGKIVSNIPLMVKTVYSMAFTPDGRYLVAATADGRLNMWDLGK